MVSPRFIFFATALSPKPQQNNTPTQTRTNTHTRAHLSHSVGCFHCLSRTAVSCHPSYIRGRVQRSKRQQRNASTHSRHASRSSMGNDMGRSANRMAIGAMANATHFEKKELLTLQASSVHFGVISSGLQTGMHCLLEQV